MTPPIHDDTLLCGCDGLPVSIEELLVECVDALALGSDSLVEHHRLIDLALGTPGMSKRVRSVLLRLDERLRLHDPTVPWSMFLTAQDRELFRLGIVQELAPRVLPRYAYHGTTVRCLESILEHGLIPGEKPVWKGQSEEQRRVRKHSDGGVFFTDTWRAAMHTWAFVAHSSSRGPTKSRKRMPAVIRINACTISLVKDPLSSAASNLKCNTTACKVVA